MMAPSTNTVPVGLVRDRAYWTRVIHNAAQVNPDHPRYGEARQVVQLALDNLDALQQRTSAKETPAVPVPGKVSGALMNAFQGLTFGGGDEALGGLAGLGTLLTGGSSEQAANRVQQTTEGFRDQRGAFYGQHPALAIGSDIVGTLANPANKILGPLTEGLGPVLGGAVIGTTLGAARGFGEGTGNAKERLPSAAMGATVGLIAGSVLGKAVKTIGPTVGKLFTAARRALGANAAPAEIQNAVETTIRARLTKLNVHPEDIERAIESWKATGELSVRRLAETHPPPLPAPTVRPGETIQPLPRTPIDPMEALPAYARAGNPRGIPIGPTPRGVGGHSYTGTYPAGTADALPGRPSPSPVGGPQNNMALQQLQELARMPQAQFDDVARHFPPSLIEQLRLIRASMVGGALP